MPIRAVLVANRGEIAVRVIRTLRDVGIRSVAVYAEPDRDSLHAALADEAYALGGATAADSYLRGDKIVDIAQRAGADAIHPGYGFLAENADFAQTVRDAGLIWIGPPPAAIAALGDKVSARRIAAQVGAPLVPGTPGPIADAAQAEEFARTHGLPIAIKAAHGGGGRGLKVARTLEEIPAAFESAVREATAAFGRGECFVERFLDHPRHVETQCLADSHGTVAVLATRDCSLQRRHQKLVEEAPAPFLTPSQLDSLTTASRAILGAAGYIGAGTCEFLIGSDGTISFLEVNTRLQVEHPVTEEITGIDLVAEQLRIAEGEPLGYTELPLRGHAIEFRINGEDPANGFLPAPGRITQISWPSGPGVRIDSGVRPGASITGAFDSMIAKIVVTGADRTAALARARRALGELHIDGMRTVTPFHRAVLEEADFTAPDGPDSFRVHTGWIESEFAARLAKLDTQTQLLAPDDQDATQRVVVEVGGKRLEVVLPVGLTLTRTPTGRGITGGGRPARRRAGGAPTADDSNNVTAPMQGTVVRVEVREGQEVQPGQTVVVLEAMKMEQPLAAPRGGVITGLDAQVGATVQAGTVLCRVE